MMRVLGRADSLNVRKVMWALDELGITCERQDCGGPFGGNDTPEYLRLNPNGLVPTLVDGETVVWESNSIIRYLADRQNATAFVGGTAAERAQISKWMDWQLSALNAPITALFGQLVRLSADKRDQAIIDANVKTFRNLMSVLTRALPDEGFLVGTKVSAADIPIGVILHRFFALVPETGLDSRIIAYHGALAARPGFRAHVAIGKP
ncbi:MAG TPA: glutathione S-transferase N-terminal domain-containing protein [Methylovirgula sp.]|jgi:glutathione S-transferase|nr:glutathione S-transferase N-terminal domain-containing protein [Methylovirgula sp.]